MKHLLLATALLVAGAFFCTTHASERIVAYGIGPNSDQFSDPMWQENLSPSVRARVREHYEAYESIDSRPSMVNRILGFKWERTRNLPVAVFDHILKASPEAPDMAMLKAFNLQILSPDHPIDLPATATLRTSFIFAGYRQYVEAEMERRDADSYYIMRPNEVISDFANAADHLMAQAGTIHVLPAFEVHELIGFVFNQRTIKDMLPLGAPVVINVRYGDVRIYTLFQWVGRPPSIPLNDGVEFLR